MALRLDTAGVWVGPLGFTYYGTILIAPEYFSQSEDPTDFNYQALFIASLAEVAACTLAFFLIDRVGRKQLSAVAYAVCGVATALLTAGKAMRPELGVALLMLARGGIFIGTCTTWVITPELYPTSGRAAGHSWCNALARVGAFTTPFWGNATALPLGLRLGLYAAMDMVAAMASLCLPRETRNQRLQD